MERYKLHIECPIKLVNDLLAAEEFFEIRNIDDQPDGNEELKRKLTSWEWLVEEYEEEQKLNNPQ